MANLASLVVRSNFKLFLLQTEHLAKTPATPFGGNLVLPPSQPMERVSCLYLYRGVCILFGREYMQRRKSGVRDLVRKVPNNLRSSTIFSLSCCWFFSKRKFIDDVCIFLFLLWYWEEEEKNGIPIPRSVEHRESGGWHVVTVSISASKYRCEISCLTSFLRQIHSSCCCLLLVWVGYFGCMQEVCIGRYRSIRSWGPGFQAAMRWLVTLDGHSVYTSRSYAAPHTLCLYGTPMGPHQYSG